MSNLKVSDSTTEVEYPLAQCDKSYRALHDGFCNDERLSFLKKNVHLKFTQKNKKVKYVTEIVETYIS